MEKEFNKEVGNIEMYEVYKTTTGLYVKEEICNRYNIGNRENIKEIKSHLCLRVNEEDINLISQASNNGLIPIYISIFDLQLVLSFNVYVDKNHNDSLYITSNLCKKHGITSAVNRVIDGVVYSKVTEQDLDKIEYDTKNDKITLKRKYIEKIIETDVDNSEYLFMYYYDMETNSSYITRKIFELCRKLDISIEGKPKIINDKNCYSITDEELKLFEEKSTYRGIERIIKDDNSEEVPTEDIIPYEDYLSTIQNDNSDLEEQESNESNSKAVEIPYEKQEEEIKMQKDEIIVPENNYNHAFDSVLEENNYPQEDNSTEVEITTQENNDNQNINDIVVENTPYEEPTPIVEEKSAIPEKIVLETIIVYRDRRTNKLYIPQEYATNIDRESKTIMRRFCYQTSFQDLERIFNKRIIIVDVYPFNKQIYNVIVCNTQGKFFVQEHTLTDLDINVSLQHKIMVNKEIYVEITRSDLDAIRAKETKNLEINIELKHITPTKKRN